MNTIIIGTRGSKLSLIQTEIAKKQLEKVFPHSIITIKTVITKGDKNMRPVPLDSVGKGWFTKEIDKELLAGSIDLAVHSLKDLPEVLPKGLVIGAILKRGDPREALVASSGVTLQTLPKGARVGTDSTRRKAILLNKRPDLLVESVRGNVLRRLEKLDSGEYDALVLAVAGLKRLKLGRRMSEIFEIPDFIPSPGQGALAVVIKENDKKLLGLLKKLNHVPTLTAVTAEREFSKIIGGGCKLPVGAYAVCQRKQITIYGVVGSLDGLHLLQDSISGSVSESQKLAQTLAERMLTESSPWYNKNNI